VTRHGFSRGLALAGLIGAGFAGQASARNPHCAGGIQYVVQATRDKDRGNMEDYAREIGKAVQQLEACLSEDPADGEALGYLGWAYAEVESAGPAGRAFDASVKALEAKGDLKKIDWVNTNRIHYWGIWFNDGIGKITLAQQAYPDFCKKPENDADATLRGEAEKAYAGAEGSLLKASLLQPSDPRTVRNLASVHALQCDFAKAEAILKQGLEISPGDSSLTEALRNVRINMANKLVDEKRYDEAAAFYGELVKSEPGNADHHSSLAGVYFSRAQTVKDDARKADFHRAGEEYAKAGELRPGDADLAFNSALSYQNSQDWAGAETQWAKTLKLRAEDTDALSARGQALVELKRCGEAVQAVYKAVSIKPRDPVLHRQLGAIYGKCGNGPKSTEELMIYWALSKGQPAADVASAAKGARQGSDAAKTLASDGVPEQIYQWEADEQKGESWFYWDKKLALHFDVAGKLSQKSDWSQAGGAATPAPGGARK